jgi:hypothetical protein
MTIFLLLLSIIKIITNSNYSLEYLVGIATDIFVFALVVTLTHFEHVKSKYSSATLLIYWLLQIIILGIELRSLILNKVPQTDSFLFTFHIQYLLVAVLVFILELLEKEVEYSEIGDGNISPEDSYNIFGKITFYWMDSLMKLGYKKVLKVQDLWELRKQDTAEENSEKFSDAWTQELSKKKPSLLKATFKAYGLMFLSAAFYKLVQDILGFVQPQLLKKMMEFAKNFTNLESETRLETGVLIAFSMLLTAIVQTVFLHQYFHVCMITGMRLKSAIITSIYRKALKLSNTSRQNSTVGEIVNLMSVDASRISELFTYLHILWSGPFQIFLAVYFLYQTLGTAVFGGVGVMILMIPVNAYLAGKSRSLNKLQMQNKDGRTKIMDELLSGIKVIKLYAWERSFLKKISNIREAELSTLKRIGYLSAFQTFTWSCTPFLVSFTSFGIYSLISNEPLTSTKSKIPCIHLYSFCINFPV